MGKNYDPEKKRAADKRYREKNKDKIRTYYQQAIKPKRQMSKEERNAKEVQRRKDNGDKRREYERAWYAKNKKSVCERSKERSKRPEVREKLRAVESKRYNLDIQFRLTKNLRNRQNSVITGRKQGKSTMELLGCTKDELIVHMETQFCSGMTWDNYGFGEDKWSIDHIKPLSLFDLTDIEEIKQAAHYTNLKPMWCTDNFSKGNRYVG